MALFGFVMLKWHNIYIFLSSFHPKSIESNAYCCQLIMFIHKFRCVASVFFVNKKKEFVPNHFLFKKNWCLKRGTCGEIIFKSFTFLLRCERLTWESDVRIWEPLSLFVVVHSNRLKVMISYADQKSVKNYINKSCQSASSRNQNAFCSLRRFIFYRHMPSNHMS